MRLPLPIQAPDTIGVSDMAPADEPATTRLVDRRGACWYALMHQRQPSDHDARQAASGPRYPLVARERAVSA